MSSILVIINKLTDSVLKNRLSILITPDHYNSILVLHDLNFKLQFSCSSFPLQFSFSFFLITLARNN